MGYCYPSGIEKTLFKWDIYVPLVTKGLKISHVFTVQACDFVAAQRKMRPAPTPIHMKTTNAQQQVSYRISRK